LQNLIKELSAATSTISGEGPDLSSVIAKLSEIRETQQSATDVLRKALDGTVDDIAQNKKDLEQSLSELSDEVRLVQKSVQNINYSTLSFGRRQFSQLDIQLGKQKDTIQRSLHVQERTMQNIQELSQQIIATRRDIERSGINNNIFH